MIRVGEERLVRYRWSGYPWYVKAGERRPELARLKRRLEQVDESMSDEVDV